jgi:hypothetical protein
VIYCFTPCDLRFKPQIYEKPVRMRQAFLFCKIMPEKTLAFLCISLHILRQRIIEKSDFILAAKLEKL